VNLWISALLWLTMRPYKRPSSDHSLVPTRTEDVDILIYPVDTHPSACRSCRFSCLAPEEPIKQMAHCAIMVGIFERDDCAGWRQ